VEHPGFPGAQLELVVKFKPTVPPREFRAGRRARPIVIKDCGRVELEADEQVTFVTESGGEYDVARKSWGFYATPSLNARLGQFGLRPVLVRSAQGKYYLLLREAGKEAEFDSYIDSEQLQIVCWLDDQATLAEMSERRGRG